MDELETKTFTLSRDFLDRYEPDRLEALMLNSANKEALILARAIIGISSMMRFNPREYRIRVVFDLESGLLRVFCDPKELAMTLRLTEDYYGFVTPRAKYHSIDDALGGTSGAMGSRNFQSTVLGS